MKGICTACGYVVRIRHTRGTRLADHGCPECGGALRGPTAGRASQARGRKYQRCVVCGRKSLHLWPVTRPLVVSWRGRSLAIDSGHVCGDHTLLEPQTGLPAQYIVPQTGRGFLVALVRHLLGRQCQVTGYDGVSPELAWRPELTGEPAPPQPETQP